MYGVTGHIMKALQMKNYEAHLEYYFPFSYRQQDTSSRAKSEASDRW
jgi:hypothetical protein